jgi:uncharacterized protein YndB with AHSA1/START domain
VTERATMQTINGEPVLRFERRLRHAPEKVWRAVSDPAEMVHWFPAAVEAELRPGAPMRFTFPDEAVVDGVWEGEVLEADPPKVYMFRWNQDVLRFELIPDGDGCLLVFTQTVGGGWIGKLGAGRTAAGWDSCLNAMVAQLDGEPVVPFDDWLVRTERYVDDFGLSEGTVREVEGGLEVHFARDLVWKPAQDVWATLVEDSSLDSEPPLRATNAQFPAGRLTTVDAPHVLEYEWLHEGEPAGHVRWAIESDPKLGVRVELTLSLPASLAELRPTALAEWHVHMAMFFAAVHGDVRCPWPADRVEELTKYYS